MFQEAERVIRNPDRVSSLPERQAYSLADLEHVLGVSKNTIRELIYSNRIAHIRVGRRVLVPRRAVDSFLSEAMEEPA